MENNQDLTIETIIESYAGYIYNLSLRLSASPDKAGDLAQETFIKAWMHMGDIRDGSTIKKWLRVVCINEYRMMMRKEGREQVRRQDSLEALEEDGVLLTDPKPLPLDEIQVEEEVANLRNGCFLAMTRKLSLNQRIAFSLIDMFGLSIGEVSVLLDLTPKAVKGLLYRARMNLESFFQGHCMFLDMDNPCRCTAWIEFMKDRNTLQDQLKRHRGNLDYEKKGYVHNPDTCRKILYYYRNMPDQRPGQEWFDQLIRLIVQYGNQP